MSIAVPVTTLAGHIAALQRAGAVAIWPLTDSGIQDGQRFQELSGNNWALISRGGQTGLTGPYGEPTAYRPNPASTVAGNPYWNGSSTDQWPPSVTTAQMTWCCWVYYPDTPTPWINFSIGLSAAPGNWIPWWGGWTNGWAGAGISWPGGTNPISIIDSQTRMLKNRWTHFTTVLDGTSVHLYWDGALLQQGVQPGNPSPVSPPGITSNVPTYLATEIVDITRLQAMALFDRALSAQEIADLHLEAPAPPTAGGVKVWDGSQWVTGTAKGWDGSQWRQAKIWTGEDWR